MIGTISKFKLWAVGMVAEDLITGNRAIKVFPHEHITNVDGDINTVDIASKQITDASGKKYNISLEKRITVTAVWLNPNSNRITPPNVRKGELVHLYQYADTDKYYWTTIGNELDLRGLEHVEYAYVNDPSITEMSDANCYKVVYSTLNKMVGIRTPDNNGELTKYEKMLYTKEGIDVIVKDGHGNSVILNSADDGFTITTNSYVTINTTTCNVNASDSVNISTGKMTIISDITSINP